jgi:hypothetical protein
VYSRFQQIKEKETPVNTTPPIRRKENIGISIAEKE